MAYPILPPLPPPVRRPSLFWPVILISLGAMFLLAQFFPGSWGIHRTWPLILVIIGVLKLLDSTRPPQAPQGPRI